MNPFFCFAIIVACFATPNVAVDCDNNACTRHGNQQTLCRFPNPAPASACGRVYSATVTAAEKAEIVNTHNELRRRVASGAERRGNPGPQPPAANMQMMQWDDELAQTAQRWANQCSFGHDQCRDVDRFSVGQNVALSSSTGTNNGRPRDLIGSWYDEVAKFNKNDIEKYRFDPNTGHYSQLVWANSNRIGCGIVRYGANGWNHFYLVCNYGPAGNYIGQSIYKIKT